MAKEKWHQVDSEVKEDGTRVCYKADGSVFFTVDKDNNVEFTIPVFKREASKNVDFSKCNMDFDELKKRGLIEDLTIKGRVEFDRMGFGRVYLSGEERKFAATIEGGSIFYYGDGEDHVRTGVYYGDGWTRLCSGESRGENANDSELGFYPDGKLWYTYGRNRRTTHYREDGTIDAIIQENSQREDVWRAEFDKTGTKPVSYKKYENRVVTERLNEEEINNEKFALAMMLKATASLSQKRQELPSDYWAERMQNFLEEKISLRFNKGNKKSSKTLETDRGNER